MIIKHTVDLSIYLGGPFDEIEPLNFSCYNFNNNFNSELQPLGGDFYYFIVNEKDYIYARTKNIHWNWSYSDESGSFSARYKRTKMALKLSELRAIKELNNYKEDDFLRRHQGRAGYSYSFGHLPADLIYVNTNDEELNSERIISIESFSDEEKNEENT